MLLRDLMRSSFKSFYPIGFLDDNPIKAYSYIHGIKVLGTVTNWPLLCSVIKAGNHHCDSQLNHKVLRKLYDGAKRLK
jgi:hypothetical protein